MEFEANPVDRFLLHFLAVAGEGPHCLDGVSGMAVSARDIARTDGYANVADPINAMRKAAGRSTIVSSITSWPHDGVQW